MADGKNDARALRVMEVLNDLRTLQTHIRSMLSRPDANPPDPASAALVGYRLLRECNVKSQRILAQRPYPGEQGIQPGAAVPSTEVQKASLQRILLDASARRFQAHKVYLQSAAGMRWVNQRAQILRGRSLPQGNAQALRALDQQLTQEVSAITDQSVMNDLRNAGARNNLWLDEDPPLDRILAWLRSSDIAGYSAGGGQGASDDAQEEDSSTTAATATAAPDLEEEFAGDTTGNALENSVLDAGTRSQPQDE